MPYTPTTTYMTPLGFSSPEKETSSYRVWTNQTNTRQLRAHRSSGSTWLDFYERAAPTKPWRKQDADPSPATEQAFHQQLIALGWVDSPAISSPAPSMAQAL